MTQITTLKDTLEKAELIYILKKQELRETELEMLNFLVTKILKGDDNHDLKNEVLKKIDKKIKDGVVDEPPQHLTCPITFVRV